MARGFGAATGGDFAGQILIRTPENLIPKLVPNSSELSRIPARGASTR